MSAVHLISAFFLGSTYSACPFSTGSTILKMYSVIFSDSGISDECPFAVLEPVATKKSEKSVYCGSYIYLWTFTLILNFVQRSSIEAVHGQRMKPTKSFEPVG